MDNDKQNIVDANRKEKIQERINELNPWFYELDIYGVNVIPAIYNEPSERDKKPSQLIYRQQSRKKLLIDEISKRFDFKNKKLMDVACNCGYWSSQYIADKGASSLLGLEGRDIFINQAKLLFESRNISDKGTFVKANVVDYDYKRHGKDEFDFVLCSGILYHIKDQELLLEKLAYVNKQVMVVDTRVSEDKKAYVESGDLYFNAIEETRDKTIPRKEDLLKILNELGYDTEIIPPPFEIGEGLDTCDNYHDEKRICIFCRKR